MKKLIFKKLTKDISLFFFISIISVATIVWIIQAVNYLDLISEDGHSLQVYFLYTLFSLPKIISKILPFIFLISLFYVIISYEFNNELIIYCFHVTYRWNIFKLDKKLGTFDRLCCTFAYSNGFETKRKCKNLNLNDRNQM